MAFSSSGAAAAPDNAPAWESRAVDRALATARARLASRAHLLVAATKAVVTERGSTDFTVGEVANRAGVSLRTFYRHFAGKEELMLALFEDEARRGASFVASAMQQERDPLERVERYVVAMWELMAAGSGYASMLVREHLRLGERRPAELRHALAPLLDLLDAALSEAAAAGSLRPVERGDAVLVFSTLLGYVHAAILVSPDEGAELDADRVWQFCLAALALGDATSKRRRSRG